ncbi:MAG: hypothetical protein DRQ78_12555 [Epsilonproteobacteria bacterium]|nr:MAG: hypothetical protein DRQ78_12555 [Campylobacterota bacterium]
MKSILIILMLLSAYVYADLSTKDIENMVDKIYKKRTGMTLGNLSDIEDPFVRIEVEDNVTKVIAMTEIQFFLKGIMNNRAYINDKWYDINDIVSGYTLKHVGKKGIVLMRDNQIKKVLLRKETNTDIITVEGR